MTGERNTILKLRGYNEWIARTNGVYHLTGERANARPMDREELKEVVKVWEQNYNVKLVEQPWIILNAKHENK
jgi:hypothetical protein